jgi:hypothetical protein
VFFLERERERGKEGVGGGGGEDFWGQYYCVPIGIEFSIGWLSLLQLSK